MTRRTFDERGQMGGAEAIPFGILVFVVGALLIANVWGVIDAKLAAEAASREAARAYVESPSEEVALAHGRAAAEEALRGHHRDPANARIAAPPPGSFQRCARIAYRVSYDVPTISLPWIGGLGGSLITATAQHSEVVDPYRSGLPVDGAQGVLCGG